MLVMKSSARKMCSGVDAQQQAQWEESSIIILATNVTSGYGLNTFEGSIHKSRK
jgi:hypothetical protein